jgi:hypothetical protein
LFPIDGSIIVLSWSWLVQAGQSAATTVLPADQRLGHRLAAGEGSQTMDEKEAVGRLPKTTTSRRAPAAPKDGAGSRPAAAIGAVCKRLKQVVEVGAEAVGQVIRGQGLKRSPRTRAETKARLEKLLDRIRADARNHGLRAIMASGSEVEDIRSLSDADISQTAAILRELHAELGTIRAYTHERLLAIQAGQRGSDVTLITLTIGAFKELDSAVVDTVARLPAGAAPATAASEGTLPAPQSGKALEPSPKVVWRPRLPRYRPPKDGW